MSARPPTRRYEARKHAIVASAVEVMNRKGVRGMTLGEIAARLDLVPTGVIYYFRNKEELAQACYIASLARFDELVADAARAGTPAERVSSFIAGYFAFRAQVARGEADPIAAFNDVRALNAPAVNTAYVDMFRRLRGLLDDGAWERPALNAAAHSLLSQVTWAAAWCHSWDAEDYGWLSQRVAAIACRGLAAPGATWNPQPLPALMAERPDDPSEHFLRAATALINEEGYAGASVEKISARLNVTKGAFYHHNENKDELVGACFDRTFQVMRTAIRQAVSVSATGYEALASVADALVRYQLSGNAPLLRTSALTSAPEAIQPRLIDQFDRLSARFASLICDGIADGSIRAVDANIAAQMVTGMINAAAELHFWVQGVTPDTAGELYVRPFFEGLAQRRA